jgi:predicted GH43/DUF377 family glycosyl hydrolase
MFTARRAKKNPILLPDRDNHWEAGATFNLSAARVGGALLGYYRAQSSPDPLRRPMSLASIGLAELSGAETVGARSQLLAPLEPWDAYGCEDPRVTVFEGTPLLTYTALGGYPFNASNIRPAIAILSEDGRRVVSRQIAAPWNGKALAVFPRRVNGKVAALISAGTEDRASGSLGLYFADSVEGLWDHGAWRAWLENVGAHEIKLGRDSRDHIEVGAVPIETPGGWLVVYSHIQRYLPGDGRPIFGIEAALLDLDDPTRVLGRTKGPILAPEEPFERGGQVPDVIFPTGAVVDGEDIVIYYGAADTTVGAARVHLGDLLATMSDAEGSRHAARRLSPEPILLPNAANAWEAKAVYNPAAVQLAGATHILYRAQSEDNTSVFGLATTRDGVTVEARYAEPAYVPRADFEMKRVPNGNSGCEDPRLVAIGDRLHVFYTAYNGEQPPAVATSSIRASDFALRRWDTWTSPRLVSPDGIDDKDACALPRRFDEGYFLIHRINGEICGGFVVSLDFERARLNSCIRLLGPRPGLWDGLKVGIASQAIETRQGWLLLYHGVSDRKTYRVGAALLDLDDPTRVIGRLADFLLEPELPWEREGQIPNVVFPCGAVARDEELFVYYGGADSVVGVASLHLPTLLAALTRNREAR